MKRFTPLLAVLLFPLISIAQPYEGTIEYDKKKQQAIIMDYSYPPEAVENAILQKMESLGYKGKEEKGVFNKDKGFRVYKGAFITDISDQSMDYILKVERKSRKEKDESTIYLIINKDGGNAMNQFDAGQVRRAKDFLYDLLPNVEAQNLELQIRDQEATIVKTEKKLKNLQDDKKSMEDRIRKLQDDIKDNEKDQQKTQEEITNQRLALETLRGRRKA